MSGASLPLFPAERLLSPPDLNAFVLERVKDAFVVLDRDFRVVSMNASAERLNGGKPRGEVIGRTHWEEWPASVGTRVEAEYRKAMEERVAAHFEWHYVELPDHDVWVEIDAYPAGEGLALFYRDITPRKQAEAETRALLGLLQVEQAQLAAIVRHIPSGVIVAEAPSGKIVVANDRVREIWDLPEHTAASVAGYAAYRGFHPDGTPYRPDEWPLARAITHGATVRNERIEIVRHDGSPGVILVSAAPIRDARNEIAAGVVIFEDVTEQELASRLAADVSAALAHSLDYDDTLRTIAGLTIPAIADWCVVDLCGDSGMRRVAVVHKDPSMREVAALVASYPPTQGSENRVLEICRTGEPLLVAEVEPGFVERVATDGIHAQAVLDLGIASFVIVPLVARGDTYGAITVIRDAERSAFGSADVALLMDVAGRAALAIANAKLYREAQRLSKAKSDFLAVMSHELRTPLNAILGYTSLLRDGISGPVDRTQEQHLDRVRSAAEHLLSLIDEILTLARIEAGKQHIDLERIELGAALRDIAALAEPVAVAKGLVLEVHLPAAPMEVTLDATKLRQIVLNLLSNAVKFTRTGTVTLLGEWEANEVRVAVSDTGIGIPPEHVESVFEAFFQEDERNVGQTSGTGLGLAVSRELARLMGGDLSLQSTVGIGTTFTLRLPAHPANA